MPARSLIALILSLVLACSAASTPAAGVGSWRWPVSAPHQVLRPYLAPATPYSAGHRGVDLAAPGGLVYAPADGIVHFAGTVVDRPVLSIQHPGDLLSSYEPVVAVVSRGDYVSRGEVIGSVVAGHCASECLHFGVRLHGEYVSPLTLLGDVPRSILLPTRDLSGGAVSGSARPPELLADDEGERRHDYRAHEQGIEQHADADDDSYLRQRDEWQHTEHGEDRGEQNAGTRDYTTG